MVNMFFFLNKLNEIAHIYIKLTMEWVNAVHVTDPER